MPSSLPHSIYVLKREQAVDKHSMRFETLLAEGLLYNSSNTKAVLTLIFLFIFLADLH